MKISELEPGQRFNVIGTALHGRLIYVTAGSAYVRYDGNEQVTITDRAGVARSFNANRQPCHISNGTEVQA